MVHHPVSRIQHPASGFTLIELMTVIAIIAILASLIVGIAGYAMHKSDMTRAMSDMEKIKNALEEYRIEYGLYPPNTIANDSTTWVSNLWRHTPPFLVLKGWNNPASNYPAIDPWGNEYRYFHDADGAQSGHVYATNNNTRFGYDLWSEGPDINDTSDNIKNW